MIFVSIFFVYVMPLTYMHLDVSAASKLFKKFYLDSHSGRRLTYQTNMGNATFHFYYKCTFSSSFLIRCCMKGTADVKMLVEKKRHELSLSTYQMVLLVCTYQYIFIVRVFKNKVQLTKQHEHEQLHFNTRTTFTVRELSQLTAITVSANCESRRRVKFMSNNKRLNFQIKQSVARHDSQSHGACESKGARARQGRRQSAAAHRRLKFFVEFEFEFEFIFNFFSLSLSLLCAV